MTSKEQFLKLIKKQLYQIYYNLELNNPKSKHIFDEYQLNNLRDLITDLQGTKIAMSKEDKAEIISDTGLMHTDMGNEDIYQFKSFLYDVNSMLLAWVILFSLDKDWQEDIPVELIKLDIFLLDQVKKAVTSNHDSLIIRPVEIEPVYSSTALLLSKLKFNHLQINAFKENTNMLMKALGKAEIFKI